MIKNLISIATLAFATHAAAADKELTFVFYYPPGGSNEITVSAIKPYLEKNGYKVNYVFYKTCGEAIAHMKKGDPNTFLSSTSADYNTLPDAKCQLNGTNDGFKLFIQFLRSPFHFCFTEKNKDLTIKDLQGSKTYTMGVVTDDLSPFLVQRVIDDSNLNMKLVKYKTGGEWRIAATTGDLDMVLPASGVTFMTAKGAKCVAATTKNNSLGLPFIGDYTKHPMAETGYSQLLWNVGPVDANVYQLMREAQKQPEYANVLKNVMTYEISDITPQEAFAHLQKEDAEVMPLRKR